MKELKIGEEIRIRCVEGGCDKAGCCFDTLPTCPITICSEMYRADSKNVHFEIVDDSQKEWLDKACEWFANYLFEIGYPDDWVRDNGTWMNGAARFRKAMED